MQNKTVIGLIASQLWLILWVIICILMRPAGVTANDGLSYFGIFVNTAIPYSIGIVGSAAITAVTLHSYKRHLLKLLGYSMLILAIGIVVTPYTTNNAFNNIHMILGSILFIIQLIYAGWILWDKKDTINIVLFIILLSAGIFSAHYVLLKDGYLLETQMIYQVAFGALLIKTR